MYVLGIESSHDDTSVALVKDDMTVLFNYKISQIDIHKKYGGTIPEIASREHYKNFHILLDKIIQNKYLNKIDYVAYTEKPGLIGSLQMGKLFAHAISKAIDKPLLPINHLEGHIFSVLLNSNQTIKYPALALVVSGGHTILYLLKSKFEKEIIGQTLDDALGEVYDKVARILELDFPGGPIIDQIYHENKSNTKLNIFTIPKTKNEYDFSFSGLKTQAINYVQKNGLNEKKQIAYEFQHIAIESIIVKIQKSISIYKPKSLILSGGVSANEYLRKQFKLLHKNTLIPIKEYTTDNGAMIAAAAIELLKK